MEGFETVLFRSKFDSWPQAVEAKESEDGRGKVAGEFMFMFPSSFVIYSIKLELSVLIFNPHYILLTVRSLLILSSLLDFLVEMLKRQGVDVKGLTKEEDPAKEDTEPNIDCTGDLQVLTTEYNFSPKM